MQIFASELEIRLAQDSNLAYMNKPKATKLELEVRRFLYTEII